MRLHVFGVMDDLAFHAVARFVEVARELGLAVHNDGIAATVFVDVDALHRAVVGDKEAFVNFAFAIHAFAAFRFTHELGETVLQHARADAAQDVLAALPFEHDGVDALEVQELREHEARWATADDANLSFHESPPYVSSR